MYQRQRPTLGQPSFPRDHIAIIHKRPRRYESLCSEHFAFTLEEFETDERVMDVSKPF